MGCKLIIDIEFFGRRGTDPAAAFLQRLTEKQHLECEMFLIDGCGYLTATSRSELCGSLHNIKRYLIGKGFSTLKMWAHSFDKPCVSSRASIGNCLVLFKHFSKTFRL